MHNRLFFLFTVLFAQSVNCQSLIIDSSDYLAGIKKATTQYHLSRGIQSAIYNGPKHVGYLSDIKGSAYFPTSEWQKGAVYYDGLLYDNETLKFDLVTNDLVIKSPAGFGIELFRPRVKYFSLGGHQFIHLQQSEHLPLPSGYYDQLVVGKMNILARRTERINEAIVGVDLERSFVMTRNFYLLLDGKYYSIRKADDILSHTGEKRKAIKKMLRKNRLKFNRDMEQSIIMIADYYNR